MKKIIWIIVLAIIVAAAGLFGWRVYHYYQLIKSGQPLSANSASPSPLRQGAPETGNPQAGLTLVEFADFTCSFSQQAFPVIRELIAKYPDKIRLVFRFFSLGGEEQQGGEEAALAALCAQEQGKFWAYHDKLFLNQKNFTDDDLKNFGRQVGLDEIKFEDCLRTKKYQAAVQADYQDGLSAGVQGTPTFFVNGQKVEGAVPLEEWEKIVK